MSLPGGLIFPRLASASVLVKRGLQCSARLSSGGVEHWWAPEMRGDREVVGFGPSGDELYQDRLDYWYPGIRFRADDAISKPIRAKERGDWKSLSLEEKKLLYRYSFRQTLSEFEAPTGYWKLILAIVCSVTALATFYGAFLNHFVYPPIPPTFDNEYKEAGMERVLVLGKGQFFGAPSKFDYENNRWK